MKIAFDRIGRFKRWIKNGIAGFFRGIKNSIVRAVRGPRGGNGNGSGGVDVIALEVTDEKDFQVNFSPSTVEYYSLFYLLLRAMKNSTQQRFFHFCRVRMAT